MNARSVFPLCRNASATPKVKLAFWAFAFAATISWTQSADFQGSHHLTAYDEPPISYSQAMADDPVSRLQRRLDQGEAQLKFDPEFGYLPSMLEHLGIPQSSQVLVFSKTSLHRDLINPRNPRAIYFNDHTYVGWVRQAPLLEISTVDPKKGGMFYVLPQKESDKPRLVRNNSCLECHVSKMSMGVPGHLVRSFQVDENGLPDEKTGGTRITHETPFADRWGGWYVTGTHGNQTHLGNLIGKKAFEKQVQKPNYLGNVVDLRRFIEPKSFLLPGSDIVALMVLEHQTHMHNFITRLNYEATVHLAQYGHVRYLKSIVEAFLGYMLFVDEVALTAPVRGTSGFAQEFSCHGPKDKQGRSLRQLDLETRLFKYPCSFLIYSDAFEQLPGAMKSQIYQRLWEILSGKDTGGVAQKIPAGQKQALLEILRETKADLLEYWKSK
ncbi:MAG: hypothetical protein AB1813_08565 [Verrucomicrobiota bacterium]